jgi:CheY-like chemotaxis protein
MNQPRSVLIVDRSEDTREVLRTALERRGVQTICSARAPDGLELAQRHHPGLIVLDLELAEAAQPGLSARFAEHSQADQSPLVVLGTARRGDHPPPQSEFVRKPYHYGPLIRKIEELLESPEPQKAEVA